MKKLLFVLMFIAAPAFATNRYVSTTGTDTGTCTNSASPCLTLNYTAGQMAGGDTMFMCAAACNGAGSGTFTENLIDAIPAGSMGAPTIITVFAGETITMAHTGACCQVIVMTGSNESYGGTAQYITLDGFKIDGNGNYPNAIKTYGRPPNITVQNMEIFNTGDAILGGGDSFIVRNSNIYNFGTIDDYAPGYASMYLMGNNMLIEGNLIHDGVNATGINVWRADGSVPGFPSGSGIVIRNNKVWNIHRHAATLDTTYYASAGMGCAFNGGPVTCSIYNNVIWDTDMGLSTSYLSTKSTVYNNTVFHTRKWNGATNGYVGCMWLNHSTDTDFKNNICWDTINVYENELGETFTAGTNLCDFVNTGCTVTSNPLFVGPTSGASANFHINSGSPARNAGANLSFAFTTDKDGLIRPLVSPWDIGAYQFSGAPPITNLVPIDNFNYTFGANLANQSGGSNWTSNWVDSSVPGSAFVIDNGPAGSSSGGTAARSSSLTGFAYYTRGTVPLDTLTVPNGLSWQMLTTTTALNNRLMLWFGDSSINGAAWFDTDGHMRACNGAGLTDLGTFTANHWYTFEAELDLAGHAGQYRVRVDGGAFSVWLTMCETTANINKIVLSDGVTTVHSFWVDNIGNVVAPTFAGTPSIFHPKVFTPKVLTSSIVD
jgi:hypothetical protein